MPQSPHEDAPPPRRGLSKPQLRIALTICAVALVALLGWLAETYL